MKHKDAKGSEFCENNAWYKLVNKFLLNLNDCIDTVYV